MTSRDKHSHSKHNSPGTKRGKISMNSNGNYVMGFQKYRKYQLPASKTYQGFNHGKKIALNQKITHEHLQNTGRNVTNVYVSRRVLAMTSQRRLQRCRPGERTHDTVPSGNSLAPLKLRACVPNYLRPRKKYIQNPPFTPTPLSPLVISYLRCKSRFVISNPRLHTRPGSGSIRSR